MADETINIKVLLDTANSAKSIQETRRAIRDLSSAALQVAEGSDEFQQLAQAAGELKDKVDDTRDTVKFFADDMRNLNGGISIAKGIAAGFEVAQASMALFGVENQNVEKSLLKVQSAMALLNGIMAIQEVLQRNSKASLLITNTLRGIAVKLTTQQARAEALEAAAAGTATITQRALNAAMAANPVGILITAIVALTGVMLLFSKETKTTTDEQKALNEELQKTRAQGEIEIKTFNSQIEALKKLKTGSEERAIVIKKINDQYGTTLKNLSDENAFLKQVNLAQADYVAGAKTRILMKINESKIESFLTEAQIKREKSLYVAKKANEILASDPALAKLLKNKTDAEIAYQTQFVTSSGLELQRLLDIKITSQKEADALNERADNILNINAQLITKETAQQKAAREKEAKDVADTAAKKTKTIEDELAKQAKLEEDEVKRVEARNKAIEDSYIKRFTTIKNLQYELDNLVYDTSPYVKEYEDLKKFFSDEEQLNIQKRDNELAELKKNSTAKERLTKEYAEEQLKINNDYDKLDLLNKDKYFFQLQNLYIKNQKDLNTINLENSKSALENSLSELDSQQKLEEDAISISTKRQDEKDKLLLESTIFYNNKRQEILTSYYDETKLKLDNNYNQELFNINNKISAAEDEVEALIEIRDGYEKTVKSNLEKLNKATTAEERKAIQEVININKEKADAEDENIDISLQNNAKLIEDKTKLEVEYNADIIDLNNKTTEVVISNENKVTKVVLDESEKRKQTLQQFYQQLGVELVNLFAVIDANITAGNVSIINQRKELALKAFDEEYQAYKNMTDKKTNEEQAKIDKDKEFADKRAAIEADFDKQKKDIEYAAAVRAWNYSMASATINLAGGILKSLEQGGPYLAITAGILGAIQLAAIVANPPQKYATGGYVSGDGGPTDDKVPAMLSNGEFVIKAATVKKIGVPMLDKINKSGVASPLVNGGVGMSTGGLVTNINNNQVDTAKIEQILAAYLSQPIKTYVTSSDVTNGQRSDDRLKSRTSF
jgi:hypothetical protein